MKKILAALAALFMSFALVACGNGSAQPAQPTKTVTETPEPIGPSALPSPLPDAPTADEEFADLIRSNVPTFASSPTHDIVDLSRQICTQFDNGASFMEVAQVFLDNNMEPYESGFTIGASIAHSCPEHENKIPSTGQSS